MKHSLEIILTGLLVQLCVGVGYAAPDAKQIEFFEKQVRPVLVERCYECHSEDSVESELRVDSLGALLVGGTRGPAIVIGDPKKSLLVSAINHSDRLHMPPKEKLSRQHIRALTQWIQMGAPWPGAKQEVRPAGREKGRIEFTEDEKSFWAFQPAVTFQTPPVKNNAWVQSPIDAFVLAKLEAAGYQPAPPADRRTLIRRITFDLTGLPPTPEEVRAFVEDRKSNALAKLIDRLLASPRYGERWGRHWLDVVRYADSNGLDENLAFANAYRYRDYVIAAFNKDKPFDRFVQEQLAGDLLYADAALKIRNEALTATSFLSLGAKMLAEDDPVKMQMDIIDEQIDTIGQAFMGLTLGCARCHDHKFDPVPTQDYYSLAGIFKSTKTMDNFEVVARWQERPLASPEQLAAQQSHQKKIDQQKSEIAQLIKDANDRFLTIERRRVAAYLLAAERQLRVETLLAKLKTVDPATAEQIPGMILVEAENYARGNVLKDFTGYGKGIGVIYNAGQYPNFTEYDVNVKQAGYYQLQLRYAAAGSRPIKIILNGKTVKSDAAGKVTGSWNPDTQQWNLEGVFPLQSGKNTIRLERQEAFPHIDKLLVLPAELPGSEGLSQAESATENSGPPKHAFLSKWVDYLRKSRSNKKSPFALWNRFVIEGSLPDALPSENSISKQLLAEPRPTTIGELAHRYQTLFDQIDRDWERLKQSPMGKKAQKLSDPEKEIFRQVLYGDQGPFALPKDLESSYEEKTRQALTQHRTTLKKLEETLPKYPQVMAVSEDKPQNVRVHIRGSHVSLGAEVPRRFPRILAGDDQSPLDDSQSGRLQLARWLTRDDHPLTTRVMVNRIWQGHFGEGLVRTPDNFGRLGERPTHPRLLDWLAVRFVEEGWSIKAMHRLILLSSTYQMSCQHQAKPAKADPENRLLWRMNRRRLEVEAVRDSILAVTGELDLTMGGSLLPTANRKYVTSTANVDPVVYTPKRRSVYLPIVRSALYEVFQAFDFANPNVPGGKRISTTVAPQALFMMNSELVTQQTRAWARRLLADKSLDDAGRVCRIYETAFNRSPTDGETKQALGYIERYMKELLPDEGSEQPRRLRTWQSFCRVIIASNEFIYLD